MSIISWGTRINTLKRIWCIGYKVKIRRTLLTVSNIGVTKTTIWCTALLTCLRCCVTTVSRLTFIHTNHRSKVSIKWSLYIFRTSTFTTILFKISKLLVVSTIRNTSSFNGIIIINCVTSVANLNRCTGLAIVRAFNTFS